jgi:transposase
VVAALPGHRKPGGKADGRVSAPYVLAGEREWLLARIAASPDLTLRALLAELADRGVAVSYFAVWHFFEHEGISFKKKPARGRAGSAGRGAPAKALAAVSGPA